MRPITAEEKKIALEAASRVAAAATREGDTVAVVVSRTLQVAKEFEKHLAGERYSGR